MLRQPIQRYAQMQATDIDTARKELRRVKTNLVSAGDKDTRQCLGRRKRS